MARIAMTPSVRFALLFLRIYLLIMLLLIGFKFVRTSKEQKAAPAPWGGEAAAQPTAPSVRGHQE